MRLQDAGNAVRRIHAEGEPSPSWYGSWAPCRSCPQRSLKSRGVVRGSRSGAGGPGTLKPPPAALLPPLWDLHLPVAPARPSRKRRHPDGAVDCVLNTQRVVLLTSCWRRHTGLDWLQRFAICPALPGKRPKLPCTRGLERSRDECDPHCGQKSPGAVRRSRMECSRGAHARRQGVDVDPVVCAGLLPGGGPVPHRLRRSQPHPELPLCPGHDGRQRLGLLSGPPQRDREAPSGCWP